MTMTKYQVRYDNEDAGIFQENFEASNDMQALFQGAGILFINNLCPGNSWEVINLEKNWIVKDYDGCSNYGISE